MLGSSSAKESAPPKGRNAIIGPKATHTPVVECLAKKRNVRKLDVSTSLAELTADVLQGV